MRDFTGSSVVLSKEEKKLFKKQKQGNENSRWIISEEEI